MAAPEARPGAGFLRWVREGGPPPGEDTPGAAALVDLAREAAAYADAGFERAGGDAMRARAACARGCDDCCHMPVETTVAEALRAWDHARRHLGPGDLDRIRTQAASTARAYPASPCLRPRPGLQAPCPFLLDGCCAVYPARPLACRGWNSTDATPCREVRERGLETVRVPVIARWRAVYANAAEALARGLEARGHSPTVFLAPAAAALAAGGNPEATILALLGGPAPAGSAGDRIRS